MTHHLAQINIARLVAPIDDPRIAEFVGKLDEINALAESSPRFVWRLKSDAGNATDVEYDAADPLMIVNMSVWETVEALKAYTYSTQHVEIFRRRAEWFEKMREAHGCLWWIPAGHVPTVAEGRERLEFFRANGASERAFWFSRPYDPA